MMAPALLLAALGPIGQSQAYHRFADAREWLGIPNFANVVTNLAFLVVGLIALRGLWRRPTFATRPSWLIFFVGVTLVAFGSAYYHQAPSDATLVWDRLPMTLGFAALFVGLLGEYISPALQRIGLPIALALGIGSVLWWQQTGDLRPYIWVQGAPLVGLPVVMLLYPRRYSHAGLLLVALGLYLAAKLVEAWDADIHALTGGGVSGHPLKHLLAAAATWWVYRMLARRRPVTLPVPE